MFVAAKGIGRSGKVKAVEMLKRHDAEIRSKFGVSKIGIFGSFARGEEAEGSDIDILVEFREGCKTFDNYMDLKFFLQDLFGRDVDLVTVHALKPQLREGILHDVIYA